MEKYLTLPYAVAFILGVLLHSLVMNIVNQVKSHAAGALGS